MDFMDSPKTSSVGEMSLNGTLDESPRRAAPGSPLDAATSLAAILSPGSRPYEAAELASPRETGALASPRTPPRDAADSLPTLRPLPATPSNNNDILSSKVRRVDTEFQALKFEVADLKRVVAEYGRAANQFTPSYATPARGRSARELANPLAAGRSVGAKASLELRVGAQESRLNEMRDEVRQLENAAQQAAADRGNAVRMQQRINMLEQIVTAPEKVPGAEALRDELVRARAEMAAMGRRIAQLEAQVGLHRAVPAVPAVAAKAAPEPAVRKGSALGRVLGGVLRGVRGAGAGKAAQSVRGMSGAALEVLTRMLVAFLINMVIYCFLVYGASRHGPRPASSTESKALPKDAFTAAERAGAGPHTTPLAELSGHPSFWQVAVVPALFAGAFAARPRLVDSPGGVVRRLASSAGATGWWAAAFVGGHCVAAVGRGLELLQSRFT